MFRPAALALLVAVAACGGHRRTPAPLPTSRVPSPPASGLALLRRMHDAYSGRWYRTLSFVQTSSFPDGHQETWYEAMTVPGRLRIDIAPLDSGKMSLFRNDSIYTFERGALARSGPFVHPLLVLGFDVYAESPDTVAAKLAALGVNLQKLRTDTWQGRPVWVVGADAGDTTSMQFWVDTERLVFVRMLERREPPANAANAKPRQIETQFNRYQPLGGGWISPEVLFYVNGQLRLKEEYHQIQADVALPDSLFDPAGYRKPEWVRSLGA